MPVTRAQVTTAARAWVGTKFQHQGRLKGRGLDCVGIVLCVGEELGLVDKGGVPFKGSNNANYSSQPLDAFVHEEAKRRLVEKPVADMRDGDVVTLRVPTREENVKTTAPCHVAIISTVCGVTGMIHAYGGGAEKVVEHIMDAKWKRRIEGCFSFPGVAD